MPHARQDGFYLLLLGSLFFVAIGALWQYLSPLDPIDFKETWSGARCIIEHRDPYQADEIWAVYVAQAKSLPTDPTLARTLHSVVSIYTNLPTTLVLVIPLATLPWGIAETIWTVVIAAGFVLACFCIWSLGAETAPRFYGALIFLLLINSGLFLASGNAAGIVVSLSVIAVWSFLQNRFVPAGIICLAVSLLIKPHDAALLWLFFLLAGGVQRRRALQTLALAVVLAVPAILWVSHVAPHWLQEYQSNIFATMSPGGRDYAGPHTEGGLGVGMIVSMQAALSLIRDDPRFSNSVAYILSGAVVLIWSIKTVRSGFTPRLAWLAIAAISAFTMLPTYHRTYDARILLLTIPACAMLWKKHGSTAWSALLLTVAAIVVSGDILWIVFFQFTRYSYRSALMGLILVPLVLFATGIFYLWVYLRRDPLPALTEVADDL
jgi:hypothetical protein